tara:strand:+ start:33 stop:518 length:486 start_codon:yes stop_codon:yes gene_type:complete
MHIKCTNCKKAFEIDEKLIPDNGRLLQCGKCDHQWFYNKENFNETIEKQEVNLKQSVDEDNNLEKQIKIKKSDQIESSILIKPENEQNNEDKKTTKINKKKQKNNLLKTFLVLILTFVALIIIVDTFKIQIRIFYPEIDNLLNSLYQTLTDINLFFKDLIK